MASSIVWQVVPHVPGGQQAPFIVGLARVASRFIEPGGDRGWHRGL